MTVLCMKLKCSADFMTFYGCIDEILNEDEAEEKNRLINEVLELQNTLDGVFIHILGKFTAAVYFS